MILRFGVALSLLGLLGVGCSRKVVLSPSDVKARNDATWDVSSVPRRVPPTASAPAPGPSSQPLAPAPSGSSEPPAPNEVMPDHASSAAGP
jgi:hypothetical protein